MQNRKVGHSGGRNQNSIPSNASQLYDFGFFCIKTEEKSTKRNRKVGFVFTIVGGPGAFLQTWSFFVDGRLADWLVGHVLTIALSRAASPCFVV